MFTKKEYEKYYANLSDLKIEQIANEGARDIKPCVLPILKKELEKRGFGTSSFNWIDMNSQKLNDDELKEAKVLIQSMNCLSCNTNDKKIFAFKLERFESYILSGILIKKEMFSCVECARKMKNKFLVKNLLLGLWSAQGLILVPIVTFYNLFNRLPHRERTIDHEITNQLLNEKRGHFRKAKDKSKFIHKTIKRFNQLDEF